MKLWNSTLVQFAIEFSPTIVHSFGIVSHRFRSVIQPHHNAMGKQTKWKLLRFRVGCVRTATWQVCDKYPATGNLWQIFLYQVHLLPLRISHSVVCVVAERLTSYSIDERGKVVDRWIAFGFIYSFSLHDKMVFFSANSPQTAKRTMCGNVHWICALNTHPERKTFRWIQNARMHLFVVSFFRCYFYSGIFILLLERRSKCEREHTQTPLFSWKCMLNEIGAWRDADGERDGDRK